MRLSTVAFVFVSLAALGCGSSRLPLPVATLEADAGPNAQHADESRADSAEDGARDAAVLTPNVAPDGGAPLTDAASSAQDAGALDASSADASTSPSNADAAPDAEPTPLSNAWPAPTTSPPTPPSAPLPPPQPSAAGLLEACAFEPASDAPLGASSICPGGVFRGDLRIERSEDANAVAGCTRIEGSVEMIGGEAALGNFAFVRVITGDFRILTLGLNCGGKGSSGFPGCAAHVNANISLEPLHSLRCVGGDFAIGNGLDSPVTRELAPLASLVEVGGHLSVASSATHASPPFANLRRVWGTITITDVSWLSVLDTVYGAIRRHVPGGAEWITTVEKPGVPSVRYLGCGADDPRCRDGVLGCELSASTDQELEAFKTCNAVLGDVKLSGAAITDLSDSAALRTVKGTLWLLSTRVRELNALASLDRVQALDLESNALLADVSALDGLALESIAVLDNAVLRDLTAWRSMRPAGLVDVRVSANASLETLGDWPWLTRAKSFGVSGDSVTSLGRFDNLTRVSLFSLNALPKLANAGSFPSVESAEQIVISNSPILTNLPAFPRLSSNVLRLQIAGNGIQDMRGLEQVTRAEEVTISENLSLTSLDGLSGLRTVAGRFALDRNPVLRSVHGASSLTGVGDLWVSMNPRLTNCEVEWLANRVNRPSDAQRFSDNGGTGPCATP